MSNIIITDDNGTNAVVTPATPAAIVVSGALIGPTGAPGATGATGPAGATGASGSNGSNGAGVPNGGTTGQVLQKNSNTNQDTGWVTPSGGGGGITKAFAIAMGVAL